ncbi:MAG TPA: alcohol dehydrogenase catalytic domain-containing protein [Candidatus Binataceae bacterium]|nr:alcohol dehydrogenase catalytic domain-containing protein [Candidatus Binataceae bacterium]
MTAAAVMKPQMRPRQAVLLEPRVLELRDWMPAHPGPGELLIQIRCALSCGTDLKTFRRGHPLWPTPTPIGHEFSGVVAEVGHGVTAYRVGDEIMCAPTAPCGDCFYCKRGQENLCDDALGRMVLGAYADMIILPAHVVATNTFLKPRWLPFEEAALLEPLSCVVHAQEIAKPEAHETAVIVGAGPFGLLHMITLRAAGVRQIVMVGRGAQRLKWASEMGADLVLDAYRDDVGAVLARLNGGYGPDLVIECTGQIDGWQDSIKFMRRGGRAVLFGGCPVGTMLNVDTRRMHYDNLTLLAPFHFRPRDVAKTREMLCARELNFGAVINAHRRLSELEDVFAMLERGEILKCAITP